MRGLKVKEIAKIKRDKKKDDISFEDIEKLMKHDSYCRHKGAIKQR